MWTPGKQWSSFQRKKLVACLALPSFLTFFKVRSIGVSNFSIPHIEAIIKATGVVPITNQIEAHPYLPQDDLVKFCKTHNISITAYSPLGNNSIGLPKLTDVDEVKAIANKLGATEAQVLIAWGVYRGYSVIPKSVKAERIESNFKQIELSKEDYESITNFGKGKHCRSVPVSFLDRCCWLTRCAGSTFRSDTNPCGTFASLVRTLRRMRRTTSTLALDRAKSKRQLYQLLAFIFFL